MDVTCLDCKRPMCPRQIREPGLVRHGGKGYCAACYTRRKRHGILPDTEARGKGIFGAKDRAGTIQCEGQGCERTLRPYGTDANDWPGTFARKARNRCSTCYEHLRDNEPAPAAVARTAETLAAYLAWRRPYRAKAGAL